MTVEHKSGSGAYNMLMSQPNIPICKVLDEGEANPYIKLLIHTAKEFAGDLVGACSRSGDFKISNMTFANSSIMALFPTGLYRTTYRFFDANDANIVNITYDTLNVNN